MDLALAGKVAIVTGASRGIGRAIAETLLAEGMRVALAARTREALEGVAAPHPDRCLVHPADLAAPDAPASLVAATMARFKTIDLVVNNAGATPRGDFLLLSDAQWDAGFALKFHGAVRLCRAAWPHLCQSRGSVVNIAGIGGRTGSAEFTIGGAVNAALLNLTKALADRGVRDGVRVNAINPGGVATDRLRARVQAFAGEHGVSPDDAETQLARNLGVARFGTPAEIAALVAFLGSPRAAYCQGTVVDADGGQTRTL